MASTSSVRGKVSRSIPWFTQRLLSLSTSGISQESRPVWRLLGMDYSPSKLGLAVSYPQEMISQPLGVLQRDPSTELNHWNHELGYTIAQVIQEAARGDGMQTSGPSITGVVLGWPLEKDGREGVSCKHVARFAQSFIQCPDIDWPRMAGVLLYDERFTTQLARRNSSFQSEIDRQGGREDSVAAHHLLTHALQSVHIHSNRIQPGYTSDINRHTTDSAESTGRKNLSSGVGVSVMYAGGEWNGQRPLSRKSGNKAISRAAGRGRGSVGRKSGYQPRRKRR